MLNFSPCKKAPLLFLWSYGNFIYSWFLLFLFSKYPFCLIVPTFSPIFNTSALFCPCLQTFCFSPLSVLLWLLFTLFLLTAPGEKGCDLQTRDQGAQLPNKTQIYQSHWARLHGDAVLLACHGCWLQLVRPVLCVFGCPSSGCVGCNEMAVLIIYLADHLEEACLCMSVQLLSIHQDIFSEAWVKTVTCHLAWCFRNLFPNHLITEDEAFVFLCDNEVLFLIPLLFVFSNVFHIICPSLLLSFPSTLPLFKHHVQFQMENTYSQILKTYPSNFTANWINYFLSLSLFLSAPSHL